MVSRICGDAFVDPLKRVPPFAGAGHGRHSSLTISASAAACADMGNRQLGLRTVIYVHSVGRAVALSSTAAPTDLKTVVAELGGIFTP